MKGPMLPCLALVLLALITPVYASVELQGVIGQDIDVTLDFRNMTSTLYAALKDELQSDETKIPEIIRERLEYQGLTNVEYLWEPVQFDDAGKSVTVTFQLSGSDIINFTFSEETTRRTYCVRTDWRKFELDVNDALSLNFSEYFGKPLSEWSFENETHPTYYYNYTDTASFDPVCYFILPTDATEVRVDGETIIFDLSYTSLAESLLNSPFTILGAIIVAVVISSLYRTMRKSEESEAESQLDKRTRGASDY